MREITTAWTDGGVMEQPGGVFPTTPAYYESEPVPREIPL